MIAIFEIIIFLTRIVFVFVVVRRVRRVRRRRRPPSVLRPVRPSPSSVVVVLCPSVRPVRPSSSSVVVRRREPANPRPHANFRKNIKIEVPQPREYAEQMAFDL